MDPIYLALCKEPGHTAQTTPTPKPKNNSTKPLNESAALRAPQTPTKTPQSKPTIIPNSHTKTTPPESFPSPRYGNVTWHTLLSTPKTETTDLSAGIAVCPAGTGHLCAHRHEQAEIYHILEGQGEVTIDGVVSVVRKGDTVFIPSNAEHGIVNTAPVTAGAGSGGGDLRWFYVFPTGDFGDVVYRFSKDGMELEEGGVEGVKAKL